MNICKSAQAMEESQKSLEEMKKALSDNDTHIQLSNLERRWQVIIILIFPIIVDLVIHNKIVEMLKKIIIRFWLITTQYQEQSSW